MAKHKSADAPTKLTVGYIPVMIDAPLYVGIEKGYFKAENLDINLAPLAGGTDVITQTATGTFIPGSCLRGADRCGHPPRLLEITAGGGSVAGGRSGRPCRAIPIEIAPYLRCQSLTRREPSDSTYRKAPPERGFSLAGR